MTGSEKRAVLILQNGTIFEGTGFGNIKKVIGEVVFNTSVVGHYELLSSPVYTNQILIFTYPLIGNYGIPDPNQRDKWNVSKWFNSDFYDLNEKNPPDYWNFPKPNLIKIAGLGVYECCKEPSHYTSKITLDDWMVREGIPGIENIDTRQLAKIIRDEGAMPGILQVFSPDEDPNVDNLTKEAKNLEINNAIPIDSISIKSPHIYENNGDTIVLIDCGMEYGILKSFLQRNLKVVRVPYTFSYNEIIQYKPKGIVVNGGPGNPKRLIKAIETLKDCISNNIPVLGIGLGNELLALAAGADTYKMKFGHNTQNQTCIDTESRKAYTTVQNHAFTVNIDSLEKTDFKIWFKNANDGTVEGLRNNNLLSVDFNPEPLINVSDTKLVYEQFLKNLNSSGGI
ncbi:MAG: glutamine-hydrolyzing carbamoyl-phosphate synthase small subunit [Candidatus Helarchaeota archaeon]|nr:glutamine-hydrolyzing carbamoyl-phosphate synthase small subunit [Candidatus Helarchaeota archaeon]